jgi:ATP phosphoribosyltransferase regulatory subunit
MFKFQDNDGKIVALRAEMTAPVARIATTKLSSALRPLRLFYLCDVFRFDLTHFERLREFRQAGIELIGYNTPEADGEVIALLLSCLTKIGLKNVRIDLGHAGLLKHLLASTRLHEEQRELLQKLLSTRNMEQLKRFLNEFDVPSQITELFLQYSTNKHLKSLSSISSNTPGIEAAQEYLLELRDILHQYRIASSVFFDFSLTRNIDYYTGVVFEASIPNLGVPLGGGGRYDNLFERFGRVQVPATGFALGVEKCLLALSVQKFQFSKHNEPKVLVAAHSRKAAIDTVGFLRNAGISCFFALNGQKEEVSSYMKRGIDFVIFVDRSIDNPLTIYDIKSDPMKTVDIENLRSTFGVAPKR